jgi:hypothetical protein
MFHYHNIILETLLKTISAKFVGGRTKISSFGQNSVLFSKTEVQKKMQYRDLSQFLEHILKKMGSTEIVMSSVHPSVCPSVRL